MKEEANVRAETQTPHAIPSPLAPFLGTGLKGSVANGSGVAAGMCDTTLRDGVLAGPACALW